MKSRASVALIVETSGSYGRHILHGIARYLRMHGGWLVFLDERERMAPPPTWLPTWNGDGIICRSTTPVLAQALTQLPVPVVDLTDRYGDLGLPRISSNMPAIGRMATEHLLERGFRHIAYCGFLNELWSKERLVGVQQSLIGRGDLCGIFESPADNLREHLWQEEREKLCQWLQSLPRPLGVVACNDARGLHILDACRALDIAVPEEVAVIGVDNTETLCELCDPPLSSVMPDAERIGFEAAVLLNRLMNGEPKPERTLTFPPKEVVTRQSTDVWAIDDPIVAKALSFIRQYACEKISIEDVLTHVSVSRSTLERGFRRTLAHSPQEEIRLTRLKRVKQLLVDTDLPLYRISEMTGFEHPEYMVVQFKRIIGQTPAQWRQEQSH